jgi:dihydroorotate dehydrogenase (fumarate)
MYQFTFVIQVAFSNDSVSSINSYGYSPHPLATYLDWIQTIILNDPTSSKPFIISITSSTPDTLSSMISSIQTLRATLRDAEGSHSRIAIELNTSCPNITNCPPPAYNFPSLAPLLSVLAEHYWKDPTLTLGLKLPPYVWSTQFEDVIRGISELPENHSASRDVTGSRRNPIAFLTCTNTLGSGLLFSDQAEHNHESTLSTYQFALPTAIGGLAGESIHALSLGNVHTFARLLAEQPTLQDVKVIGVGGVTSPEALDRMQKVGASVVGCATLLGKEGVGAFKKLSAGRQD